MHSPTPATEKCNNKGPVSCRKHTQIYICTHAPTWFTAKLHRAFLAGCPGQAVQYTAGRCAVVPLIQNECGAVHLSGNQTAVTLVRSLFPQPQTGPKLPKVPDLCFHQLSFCDKWLLAEEGVVPCMLPWLHPAPSWGWTHVWHWGTLGTAEHPQLIQALCKQSPQKLPATSSFKLCCIFPT